MCGRSRRGAGGRIWLSSATERDAQAQAHGTRLEEELMRAGREAMRLLLRDAGISARIAEESGEAALSAAGLKAEDK